MAGSVWKVLVKAGDRMSHGMSVAIVESMKMEINLTATADGTVERRLCAESSPVSPGQRLMVLRSSSANVD